MEPAEDASLEPAIQWLAQSILASPLIKEQAPWVREAGLAEEMEALKSEIKAVQLVVSAVKGRALGNEPLAESLVELKELLYDADDAVDELDYRRLLQLDQGFIRDLDQTVLSASQADRSTDNADVPNTSGTSHDLEQTDGHQGALQADRSIHNTDVPSTNGALPDPHETDGHGTQSRSVGKLRSKLWKEFEILEFNEKGAPVKAKCIHCKTELGCPTKQGTGVLQNHLKSKACLQKQREGSDPLSTADATANPAPALATGNLSSKKRRRDEESTRLITANADRWNKDDFSKMIRDITVKMGHIREGVIRVLSILGSDFAASSNHSQGATSHQRRRTSGTLQGRGYGRDVEKKAIIELMMKEEIKSAIGAAVLPILGIAGVGKTALAQLVYNHPAVKELFDHMVWISVSNNFDAIKLTKDMVASVSKETHVRLCSFAKLQEMLESHIRSKRVLLILDDVWDGIDDYQWNQLLAPFNSNNVMGNMIIVTTRKPCVAKRRGTVKPIKLEALKNDDFWLFFKACAFGDVKLAENYRLRDLGQQIAQKLKGNPLAAKTAGALLSEHRTVGHWSSILKNEGWKSLTISGGIMSALKLCYDQLPYHLQQCFTYCSLFPCSYEYLAEELVRIWISQGFVKCKNSSKRLEEIGQDYLADLVNLGFFQPSGCHYVMYNLMHDFARVVSRTECAIIDGLQCNIMLATVRHVSIISELEDQTGTIAYSEKFEEILRNTVLSVGKLRSLVLIGQYSSSFFQFFQNAFQKAHNLRLLHLSATSADFRSLCNLANPAHLRYLKLENGHDDHGALPQVLSNSFHLQALDINRYSVASREPGLFPSLERLRCLTRLKLSNMQNITEISVPSLEELVLFEMPKLKRCSCTSAEGLRSSLRVLEVQGCPALEVFDLFQKVHNYETEHNTWLPSLKKLIIFDCPNLHVVIPLPPSATDLEIEGSSGQTLRIKPNSVLGESSYEMDDKFLSFQNMRYLKNLEVKGICNLVSFSLRTFGLLRFLKSLEINNCKELSSNEDLISIQIDEYLIPGKAAGLIRSDHKALPSLESLIIKSCGITGKWLSLMLWHSRMLKELEICDCPRLTQLQIEEDTYSGLDLISASEAASLEFDCSFGRSAPDGLCRIPLTLTSSLRQIKIWVCPHLIFDGSRKGFSGFTSLEQMTIWQCPEMLSSWVHNDGQADGRWPLPQSLQELSISHYPLETLWPCFVGNLTHLKKLQVTTSPHLKTLQLHSCTAMEYLEIPGCRSLAALEGLRSLMNLRELAVDGSPALASLATSGEGYDCSQLPGLESLHISELSHLTTSFCKGLSCLQSLSFFELKETRLTDEQEKALLHHGSLQELIFSCCEILDHLPAGLHSLPALKTLKIICCYDISRLPKEGLPPSLEVLDIEDCSSELSTQCRLLATAWLRVKIDGYYVN